MQVLVRSAVEGILSEIGMGVELGYPTLMGLAGLGFGRCRMLLYMMDRGGECEGEGEMTPATASGRTGG